jgi:hypothetical protein
LLYVVECILCLALDGRVDADGAGTAGVRQRCTGYGAYRGNRSVSGWRVYGTNCPVETLTLKHPVLAHRAEYQVERNPRRLNGKPLSLTPVYLEADLRAAGLIRLLSIGLYVLSLPERCARERLNEQGDKPSGMYAGNPPRATARFTDYSANPPSKRAN